MITSSNMVMASSFADIVAERRDSLDPAMMKKETKFIAPMETKLRYFVQVC